MKIEEVKIKEFDKYLNTHLVTVDFGNWEECKKWLTQTLQEVFAAGKEEKEKELEDLACSTCEDCKAEGEARGLAKAVEALEKLANQIDRVGNEKELGQRQSEKSDAPNAYWEAARKIREVLTFLTNK
jgi:hypothetical protein